jgi:glycerophosphoryl diester phosphodiesterase
MWVIAHRGASAFAPENTLAAFRRAVEIGARFIEADLQLSRDARLVAIHDDTVDRTTNGHGPVSALTHEELRKLDAGSWFDGKAPRLPRHAAARQRFAGERIPTVEEVLAFGREHDIGLYLELKPSGPTGVEHAILGALRAANEIPRTVVLSFHATVLARLRRLEPLLVTGYLCSDTRDAVARAVETGARQLLPRANRMTAALVSEAHAHDLKVVPWTVNNPKKMRRFIAMGADGIITDRPNELVNLLAAN